MKPSLLKKYIKLVEFLGITLGPDYEIALYNITPTDQSIVAIANGQISGRKIGAPLTDHGLKLLKKAEAKNLDYHTNYTSYSMDNKQLRAATLLIKDENNTIVGLLSLHFDDRRFVSLTQQLLGLCHPDELLTDFSFEKISDHFYEEDTEHLGRTMPEIAKNMVQTLIHQQTTPLDQLTRTDKSTIVKKLHAKGIFLLKGSVSEVAKLLNLSEATIYRYVNDIDNPPY